MVVGCGLWVVGCRFWVVGYWSLVRLYYTTNNPRPTTYAERWAFYWDGMRRPSDGSDETWRDAIKEAKYVAIVAE